VLSDPSKRSRYDQLGESYTQWQQGGGAPGNFNWQDWFSQQQQSRSGRVQADHLDDLFGGGFSDFFSTIFGGMGADPGVGNRRGRRSVTPGYEQAVTISFKEAFLGTICAVQIGDRRLEVKIPAGARTGTKVRVPEAVPGQGGQKADLYLVITVSGDERFERDRDDLKTETAIDLITAVLGGQVSVPTPAGDVVLTIPAGTQAAQTFRLAGRGMPHLKDPKTFGDLYVRVKVQIPRHLTDRQRTMFEELRRSLN
jgi:curved DNA-binding protein